MIHHDRVRFFFDVLDNAIPEDSALSSDEVEAIARALADHPLVAVLDKPGREK